MALKTPQEYIDDLRVLAGEINLYMLGEKSKIM